eukprot:8740276-Pyramimonas_sp.AAC.1
MAATHIDWVQQAEDYIYHDVTGQEAQQFIAPWTEEGLSWAKRRLSELRDWLRRAPKRRACPP